MTKTELPNDERSQNARMTSVTVFPGNATGCLDLVARASRLKFTHIFGTLCCGVTGRRPVVYEKGAGMEAPLDASLAVEG
ncbi:MAG: hypothetical protein ABSH20_19375, partial [Tepidisphaeraceae bacterium]